MSTLTKTSESASSPRRTSTSSAAAKTPKASIANEPDHRTSAGHASRLAASRILSETAHDLRSPLTSVMESIRLVAGGEFGSLNQVQVECLRDAIDVCDSMERLVTDMLQIERLQAGRCRPHRAWFAIESIRQRVSSSLDSLLRPRQISIVWDGIESTTPIVFGDADKISRLLANLIGNAARETSERKSVMVRAIISADRQSLIVSVIDSGRGLEIADWARVSKRGTSDHGSEGLGLSISRQLAAVHFSPLTILSRAGRGTEVSFELPIGGAASVASQWAQWRSLHRTRMSPRRVSGIDYDSESPKDPHRFFEDGETRLMMLHHDGPAPEVSMSALVLTVSAGAMVAKKAVEAFDERLQHDQRQFDLVYRVSDRRWVVVWDAKLVDVKDRIDSLSSTIEDLDEGTLRLKWSEARSLAIGPRHTATTLVDTFTREGLYEREPIGFFDDDMSLDGSNQISPSLVPEERLREELSRLSTRFSRRAERLHRQARATR